MSDSDNRKLTQLDELESFVCDEMPGESLAEAGHTYLEVGHVGGRRVDSGVDSLAVVVTVLFTGPLVYWYRVYFVPGKRMWVNTLTTHEHWKSSVTYV